MVVRSRQSGLFSDDEELGKKNDDHKPSKMGTWNVKHRPTWFQKRRVAGAVLACILVYLFVHYIPTDLGPPPGRRPYTPPPPNQPPPRQAAQAEKQANAELTGEQYGGERHARTPVASTSETHSFDGPVKFYHLATTLREAQSRKKIGGEDRNILFAASDLSSAAAIIPIACEMGNWRRNYVHFAILGSSEAPLDTIKQINNAAGDTCRVTWHDARPDYASVSSHKRLQTAVAGALGHIGQFLQPPAVVTVELESEDSSFEHGMRRKVKEKSLTHIQVPKEDSSKLAWLARLDAASLGAWHTASFDILVQAPMDSSGSLIRLLRSLSTADYTGFYPPRLIIDLPYKLDKATQNMLSFFQWPPHKYRVPGQNEHLIVRRRLSEQRMTTADASFKFIESFYPQNPAGPHALLLSPQVELSPLYFHYLKAHMLEYKHSGHAMGSSRDLFGISLEAPSIFLNGSKFLMPEVELKDKPFRWQAPNANAALYFADKWIEAHSFIKKRHSASFSHDSKGYLEGLGKEVTTDSPAWLEQFLEFMRNRGWSLHYPAISSSAAPGLLSVTHNELYQAPEEFSGPSKSPTWDDIPPTAEDILTVRDDYLSAHTAAETSRKSALNSESPLLDSLDSVLSSLSPPTPRGLGEDDVDFSYFSDPNAPQPLPRIASLPLLDHLGNVRETDDLLKSAEHFRLEYRQLAGGCDDNQAVDREDRMYPLQAEDLFCFDERRADAPPDGDVDNEALRRSLGSAPPMSDPPPEEESQARPLKQEDPPPVPFDPSKQPQSSRSEPVAEDTNPLDTLTKTDKPLPNRIADPSKYEETARAGFKAKAEKAKLEEAEANAKQKAKEAAAKKLAAPIAPPPAPAGGVKVTGSDVNKKKDGDAPDFPRIQVVDHPVLKDGAATAAQNPASAEQPVPNPALANAAAAQGAATAFSPPQAAGAAQPGAPDQPHANILPGNEAEDEFLRLAAPRVRGGGAAGARFRAQQIAYNKDELGKLGAAIAAQDAQEGVKKEETGEGEGGE